MADQRNQTNKTDQWMEVLMTFLLLAGCNVATADALRHVHGRYILYELCVFQG